ncbi:MAG: hypothetical protein JXM70_18385 [Pirellulales bacterium]|nr:hypothetical protein [Pirellulales bacterium]
MPGKLGLFRMLTLQYVPILLGLCLLLPLVAGCGGSESVVSGTVTYDGQPVEKGSILFQPVDGKGASCGGPIENSKYKIETTPGKKLVQIVAVKKVKYGRLSPAEELKRTQEAAMSGDTSGIIDRADTIPPNAQGNNTEVEIKPGSQTLDFHLKKP